MSVLGLQSWQRKGLVMVIIILANGSRLSGSAGIRDGTWLADAMDDEDDEYGCPSSCDENGFSFPRMRCYRPAIFCCDEGMSLFCCINETLRIPSDAPDGFRCMVQSTYKQIVIAASVSVGLACFVGVVSLSLCQVIKKRRSRRNLESGSIGGRSARSGSTVSYAPPPPSPSHSSPNRHTNDVIESQPSSPPEAVRRSSNTTAVIIRSSLPAEPERLARSLADILQIVQRTDADQNGCYVINLQQTRDSPDRGLPPYSETPEFDELPPLYEEIFPS